MGKNWLRRYAERRFLHEVQRGRCAACERWLDLSIPAPAPAAPTFDHVIPASRGGPDQLRNYVLKHYRCNFERGDRPPTAKDLYWQGIICQRIDEEEARERLEAELWRRRHPLVHRLRRAVRRLAGRKGKPAQMIWKLALRLTAFAGGVRPPASHWTLRRLL